MNDKTLLQCRLLDVFLVSVAPLADLETNFRRLLKIQAFLRIGRTCCFLLRVTRCFLLKEGSGLTHMRFCRYLTCRGLLKDAFDGFLEGRLRSWRLCKGFLAFFCLSCRCLEITLLVEGFWLICLKEALYLWNNKPFIFISRRPL